MAKAAKPPVEVRLAVISEKTSVSTKGSRSGMEFEETGETGDAGGRLPARSAGPAGSAGTVGLGGTVADASEPASLVGPKGPDAGGSGAVIERR